jgi:hypothetical protein
LSASAPGRDRRSRPSAARSRSARAATTSRCVRCMSWQGPAQVARDGLISRGLPLRGSGAMIIDTRFHAKQEAHRVRPLSSAHRVTLAAPVFPTNRAIDESLWASHGRDGRWPYMPHSPLVGRLTDLRRGRHPLARQALQQPIHLPIPDCSTTMRGIGTRRAFHGAI